MRTVRAVLLCVVATCGCRGHIATQPEQSGVPAPNGAFAALSVSDIERMRDWYAEVLGLHVVSQGVVLGGTVHFALLEGTVGIIELVQRSDARPLSVAVPGAKSAVEIHGIFKAGLVVSNIDALHARLVSRGVTIAYPLESAKDTGLRSFSVRDPESNLIQFFGR